MDVFEVKVMFTAADWSDDAMSSDEGNASQYGERLYRGLLSVKDDMAAVLVEKGKEEVVVNRGGMSERLKSEVKRSAVVERREL